MVSLPPDLLARYRRDGFAVIENFAPPAECDALKARAEELVAGFEPPAAPTVFTTDEQARKSNDYFLDSGDNISFFFEELAFDQEGKRVVDKERAINKIGHALHDLDPLFNAFSRAPRVRQVVEALGLEAPRLMQSMYIFKQPRIGGEVRCHQDATFLHTTPQSVMGLWFALEDATEENGCLWALPGGHKAGLGSLFVRTPQRTTEMHTLDPHVPLDGDLVPLAVKKGTLVVLDGFLPHLSRQNTSDRSRHAYTLHLVSGTAAYPATNWLQRSTPALGF